MIALPPLLTLELENLVSGSRLQDIAAAQRHLSDRYRDHRGTQRMSTTDAIAYALSRLPATYAAVCAAANSCPSAFEFCASHLDLGAGPGSATLAMLQHLPHVHHATMVERDSEMIRVGERLLTTVVNRENLPQLESRWIRADLSTWPELSSHDAVTLSYVTNELSRTQRRQLLERAWSVAKMAVLVVEPGTPAGFEAIADARQNLLDLGAHLAAPCCHSAPCPLLNRTVTHVRSDVLPAWCHFSVRLPRMRVHRVIKGGSTGWEDERFSYVIATRQQISETTGDARHRIIASPKVSKGEVQLPLCQHDATARVEAISRSDKQAYRQASKATWGELWPGESAE